ncbi:tol-pal system YbgF family protein [Methylophilus flavus]|uniref:Tol-pal system YbgF family protein n=1 Tax=Methylophilus flavus TaxID=640084 RepID=A0ABW3PEH7_9PROT
MKITFCCFVILITLSSHTLAEAGDAEERLKYETFKAKTEISLESLKSVKSQDLMQLQAQIDYQKNLIEQINNQANSLNNNIAIGSVMITVLVSLIGFFSYRNAKTDAQLVAKQEAQYITQQEVKNWFDRNTKDLNTEIDELKLKLRNFEDEANNTAIETKELMADHLTELLDRSISESDNYSNKAPDTTKSQLAQHSSAVPVYQEFVLIKQLEDPQAAIENYNNQRKELGSELPEMQSNILLAQIKKGDAQRQLNKPKEAVATYSNLIKQFGNTENHFFKELIARAYVNKGDTQHQSLNQPKAAIITYDTLIQKFGDSNLPDMHAQIARAYVNKGFTQGQSLDQPEVAVATWNALIQKLEKSLHPVVQAHVAHAYLNRGFIQEQVLSQPEAELETYNHLIQKFAGSKYRIVQAKVAIAYDGLGFKNLLLAKQAWKIRSQRERLLKIAIYNFEKAVELCDEVERPMILSNIAYSNWLLGIKTDTKKQLAEAFALNGKRIRQFTLENLEMHSVSPDESFKDLLNTVFRQTVDQNV